MTGIGGAEVSAYALGTTCNAHNTPVTCTGGVELFFLYVGCPGERSSFAEIVDLPEFANLPEWSKGVVLRTTTVRCAWVQTPQLAGFA